MGPGFARPVITGGLFSTFAPRIVLASEGFDHVCMGEGERAMSDLISCIEKGNDPGTKPVDNIWTDNGPEPKRLNPMKDLDTLPFVDRNISQ